MAGGGTPKPKGPSEAELKAEREAKRREAENKRREEELTDQRRRRGFGMGAFRRDDEDGGLLRSYLGV